MPKSPRTLASVPAETTAAHRSEYDATIPIGLIAPHPKNIRHTAVADDELVESIRENGLLQPLVVAPSDTPAVPNAVPYPTYRLIAGHRRLDGLLKAGFTHAPAIIRHDLTDEADQVAAMLVENGRRKDLTPMEEAEGIGQLRFDFGWKPGAIAKASGHSLDTVNKRLKLLKLDDSVKKSLEKAQLTIEDAITVAELPKAEQSKVARYAGTGNFKWEISQAKERVKRKAAAQVRIDELTTQGVRRIDTPSARQNIYSFSHAADGVTPLHQTFSRDAGDHPDCLAFLVLRDYVGVDEAHLVCTNLPAHDEQLDAERAAARRAAEAEQEAEAQREAAERIARQLRIDAIRGSVSPKAKIDDALLEVLRVFTLHLVENLHRGYGAWTRAETFFELLDVPEDARWGLNRLWTDDDQAQFRTFVSNRLNGSTRDLLDTFTALAAAHIERDDVDGIPNAANTNTLKPRESLRTALAWLDLAEAAGHDATPIDHQLRSTAAGTETP